MTLFRNFIPDLNVEDEMAAIETTKLTRRFGARTAVDDVAMTVPERAVYGFLGRRSEEHTSELQSRRNLVCRLLLEKKNNTI